MAKITYVHPDGTSSVVDVEPGNSIMRGAKLANVEGILAQCGGGATCGTCHIYVDKDNTKPLPAMHDLEDGLLCVTASPRQDNSRLSCQIPVTEEMDGLVVHLPEKQL